MQNKQVKAAERKARRRVSAQHVALKAWESRRTVHDFRSRVIPPRVRHLLMALMQFAGRIDWKHA